MLDSGGADEDGDNLISEQDLAEHYMKSAGQFIVQIARSF